MHLPHIRRLVERCLDDSNINRETCLSPPVKIFYWPFQGGASLMDHFCYLCFVFVMLSFLIIATLCSPAGKGLTSWLACIWSSLVFCHFPMRCPESDVVPDCMDSWSLPSHFLCYISSWWLTVNIFSEGHLQRLHHDPTWQKESNLKLNHQKCKLLQTRVEYIGHILSEDGIEADPQILRKSTIVLLAFQLVPWSWNDDDGSAGRKRREV